MRISVVVSSYNYENYIVDAIESVLAQTKSPNEIIIVDDGSKDRSVAVIQKYVSEDPSRIKLVTKSNGGQLSSFNEAFKHVTGDLVFFLDSDDMWQPDYIKHIYDVYEKRSVDFVISAYQEIGESNRVKKIFTKDTDLGFAVAFTYFKKDYITEPTSALSIRKKFLDKVLPLDCEADWRVNADRPLRVGASLAGCHRFYSAEPLVLYRVHASNAHKKFKHISDHEYRYNLAKSSLLNFFSKKFYLTDNMVSELIDREVLTDRDDLTRKLVFNYMKMIFSQDRAISWKLRKVRTILSGLIKHKIS